MPGATLRRYFEGLLLLLLATGFATLASTGRLGWPVTLAATVAFLLRGYQFWRRQSPRLPPRAMLWALIVYSPIYCLDGLLLSGGFTPATLHLVVLAGAAQMFAARTNRDHMMLGLLAMLEVLAAALLTVSGAFFVLFVIFLALLVATLIALEMTQAQAVAPAVAAAVAPERHALRRLLRFSLLLSLVVAGLSAVIFLVLPRLTMGAWAARPTRALSGFSDQVVLGSIAQLQRDDTPVMHVKLTASDPAMDPAAFQKIPWRGRGLTAFDGTRWYAPDTPGLYRTDQGRFDVQGPFAPPALSPPQIVRYQVTLEPIGSPVLFFPARLLRAATRYPVLAWDRSTSTLSGLGRGFSSTAYSGVSDVSTPSAQQLRAAANPNFGRRRGLRRYLQLPENLDPRIRSLARQVVAHAPVDNYDRMQALTRYLQTHYQYSLDNLPQGPDPLATFLFDQPQGDCEYFASALAVMARSLGIPTRLVNGFVLGNYNSISGEFEVTGGDAHAWVETYFPLPRTRRFGAGTWVAFDATPAAAPAAASAFPQAGMIMDALSSLWQEWVVDYDRWQQAGLAQSLQNSLGNGASTAWNQAAAAAGNLSAALLPGADALPWGWILLGLALAALAAWAWWLRRRRTGARPAGSRLDAETSRQAQLAYRRLQRCLRRHGIVRHPAQTAEELLNAVSARYPALAGAVAGFVTTYDAARFGPADAALLPQLTQQLKRVRQFRQPHT